MYIIIKPDNHKALTEILKSLNIQKEKIEKISNNLLEEIVSEGTFINGIIEIHP